jgi:hypothetical protein
MSAVLITKGTAIENSAVILLARVLGANGVPIVQSDITSILLRVFDQDLGTLVTPTGGGGGYTGTTLVVSAVVINAPAADVRWTYADPPNVVIPLDGSFVPDGNKNYQIEVKFTPAAGHGDPFYVLYVLRTQNVIGE